MNPTQALEAPQSSGDHNNHELDQEDEIRCIVCGLRAEAHLQHPANGGRLHYCENKKEALQLRQWLQANAPQFLSESPELCVILESAIGLSRKRAQESLKYAQSKCLDEAPCASVVMSNSNIVTNLRW